ncbi:hypothetical protein K438DRAFT_1798050 [Mycena galopus ATCC 62051]|nr:hypothetical protein K438DRAFT_1798050 [Mycena galopus ATCC 62051]
MHCSFYPDTFTTPEAHRGPNTPFRVPAPFMMLASGSPSSGSLLDCHIPAPFAQNTLSSLREFDHARASVSAHELYRRHSLSLMRKPLRSSPLAGPVISSEEEEIPKTRRARALSTPNLHSRTRSEPSPLPSLAPLPPLLTPPRLVERLSKHASLLELVKRPLVKKAQPSLPASPSRAPSAGCVGPSIIHTPLPPLPLSPPSPSGRQHVRARSRSLTASMSGLSTPSFGLSSLPRAHTAPRAPTLPSPKTTAGIASHGPAVGHYRNDSEDNWLTATPYVTTPRFSRLGLAAPSVVLPVPARAARRKVLRGEGGKRVSLVHPPPVHPPPVTPPRSSSLTQSSPVFFGTPILTRSRSHSVSSEGPSTPGSASVFGADNVQVVLAESDQCAEEEVDLALVSPHHFDDVHVLSEDLLSDDDHAHAQNVPVPVHKPDHPLPLAVTEPPSSWGLAMRRHRRSYVKGVSFLSFGSGDSAGFSSTQSPVDSPDSVDGPDSYFPSFPVRPTHPAHSAPALALTLHTLTEETVMHDSHSKAGGASASKITNGGGAKKAAGKFRRFMRTISSVGRRT